MRWRAAPAFFPRQAARITALACQGPDPAAGEPESVPRTGETHYTLRRLAGDAVRVGIVERISSPERIRRMLLNVDVAPHHLRHGLTRTDPRFHAKAGCIPDLYEHGVSEGRHLSFDEETQM